MDDTQTTKTVLVIDDEASLLQSLAEAIEEAGFTVIRATNGDEGLKAALAKHPDLILSDNIMPIMDGVQMVAEIRKDDWGKTVPIIVMTNMFKAEAMNQSLQSGTDYVMKGDMGIDNLVTLVKERLAVKTA